MEASLKAQGIPKLSVEATIEDENNDGILEGREKITLKVKVKNQGSGIARSVVVKIKNGEKLGLPNHIYVGDILPGEEKTIEKVIKLKDKIAGNYTLEVYAESQKGFMSEAK